MNKPLLIIFLVIFLCGCSQETIRKKEAFKSYTPQVISSVEAQNIVKSVLYEQPEKFAPTNIELNDDYMRLVKDKAKGSIWTLGLTTVTSGITISFDNVGRVEYYLHRHGYLVDIYDGAMKFKYRVYISTEQRAQNFLNAFYTLLKEPKPPFNP